MVLLLGTILIITTCENDLQNFILDDLFAYKIESAKLLPTNGSTTESFGYAVDIDGDYAIVGAPAADSNIGAAYFFTRSSDGTWNSGQRITASDGATGDMFGSAVAISGDWAVVGAYRNDADNNGDVNDGKVYIFQRDSNGSWSETQNIDITNMNGGDISGGYDMFGISVAIDGSWIAIGASQDDRGTGTKFGAAYILIRSGADWNYDDRLDGVIVKSGFGSAVDIDGDIMVVGASNEDTDGDGFDPAKQGAAYIYRLVVGGWELSDRVTASTPTHQAHLGRGVSISTNYLAVGAYGEAIAGTAGFYTRSGSDEWDSTAVQQLKPDDQKAGDRFGLAIATNGSFLLIGAPFADYYAPLSGVVFLYKILDDGSIIFKNALGPSDVTGIKGYGFDLAMNGQVAIIGAIDDPYSGGGPGAAYIFE